MKKLYRRQYIYRTGRNAFYTYFTNKIIANYDTDPNKIIYDNLNGHAVSQGISLNLDILFPAGLKILAGATLMDVYRKEGDRKIQQLFTEKFTGVWNIGYTFRNIGLTVRLYRKPVWAYAVAIVERNRSPQRMVALVELVEHSGNQKAGPWF